MYQVLVLFQHNTRGQIATWSTCCFSNSHKVFSSAASHRRVPEGEKISPCSCQQCYVWRNFSELIGNAFLPSQHAVEISGWLKKLCHVAMSPWPRVPVCAGHWVTMDTAVEQVEIEVGRGRHFINLLVVVWDFLVLFFPSFFFFLWNLVLESMEFKEENQNQSSSSSVHLFNLPFIFIASPVSHQRQLPVPMQTITW